jgi:ankyrin repeat protein
MAAAHHGNRRALREMLDRGADPRFQTQCGADALTCAVLSGDADCVEQLLRAGADPNAPGRPYPVLMAIFSTGDRADLATLLLDAGADPTAHTRDGATPLTNARTEQATECIHVLQAALNGDAPL